MSLDKHKLSDYLNTMLTNTISGAVNPNNHFAMHLFAGDGCKLTLATLEGQPSFSGSVNAANHQTISIIDDGYIAMKDFTAECNKDEVIGNCVGPKAIQVEIEGLIRKWYQ